MHSCSRLALRFALLATVAMLLAPREALATPAFPGVIARELELAAPPACDLCHAGGVTRRGTVTTPFGTTMRSRGLVAYDERSLATALKAISAENKDSDEDGTPDVQELKEGLNPNLATGEDFPPPEYGCAVRSSRDSRSGAFALVLIGLCAGARRRSRTRRARR